MNKDLNDRYIWLNGEIMRVHEARIGVLSPTAQFGLNVFEGIPCYWNDDHKELYAFRLEEHYARLMRSACLLQIDTPFTVGEMKQALIDTIRANGYKENLSVRQTLFVDGDGSWGSKGPVGMFVAPIPRRNASAEYNKKGLHCCISSWRRIDDNSISPRIKCGANYINSRMAQLEALRNGYDTAIFLNKNGKIAEGPGSCLFIVKNKKLITPGIGESILESITRDTVIKIARYLNLSVEEREIERTELYSSQEAFLCGSAMAVTPVISIDGYKFNGTNHSSVTEMIQSVYQQMVEGKMEYFTKFITPIWNGEKND